MGLDGSNKSVVVDEGFTKDNSKFFVQDNIIVYQSLDKMWYKQDLNGENKFEFDYGDIMGVEDGWIYFIKIYPTRTIEIARLVDKI